MFEKLKKQTQNYKINEQNGYFYGPVSFYSSPVARITPPTLLPTFNGRLQYEIYYQINIRMRLTVDEKLKYSKIIFQSFGRRKKVIDSLDENELQVLRSIYAQKIAFQCVNGSLPQVEYNIQQTIREQNPENTSLWASIFWCFYPENNRDYFDIPSTLFVKRALYPFCFWNSGFFQINPQIIEHYGFTWMLFTYTISLFLASTLTQFFLDPVQYKQDYGVITQCIAIVFIFKIIEPMLHACAIGCLGSVITSDQCFMLSGYSLSIYIIPTIFCMAPSIYWRTLVLSVEAILRVIFLFRNYQTKIDSRKFFFLILLVVIEIMYCFVVYRSLFMNYSLGYGFSQAFAAVFGTAPTDTQAVSSAAPPETNSTKSTNSTSNSSHAYQTNFLSETHPIYALRRFNF